MLRSCTNYYTIAANTSVQDFAFVNAQDDYRTRNIKGILVTSSQTRVSCNVVYQGRVYASFDLQGASRFTQPLDVQLTAAPQQQPHIQFQDNAGTGQANVGVTLFYDVDTAP